MLALSNNRKMIVRKNVTDGLIEKTEVLTYELYDNSGRLKDTVTWDGNSMANILFR